jgi:ABC-type sulfate transport system permease component
MFENFLCISAGIIVAMIITSLPWYVKLRNRFYSMIKEAAVQAAFEVLSRRAGK